MSKLTSSQVKSFLILKKGYVKKSPLIVAKKLWKSSDKASLPKTKEDVQKEIDMIRQVQSTLRTAQKVPITSEQSSILEAYEEILEYKTRKKKRLFFDLEVSPNIVFSWRIGGDISLSHDDIIKERAIICACYKWEGEKEVHSLEWNKGDDKQLLIKFSQIIDSADEIITQNGDAFDIKWLRTRCLYHNIPVSPKFNSIDTLKMAKSGFKFNSNKLDYMGQFLDMGKKIKTDYDLWKDITLDNSKTAMDKMVRYCKNDVILLEKVYHRLAPYTPPKKFKYKL